MTFKINNSLRQAYKACPRKFYWRYVAGIEPARGSMALALGTAFHRGVELWRASGGMDSTAAITGASETLTAALADQGRHIDELLYEVAKLAVYLTGYFRLYIGDCRGQGQWQPELRIETDDEHGTLDALFIDRDGGAWVVDDKTRSDLSPDQPAALVLEEQLLNYGCLAREAGYRVVGAIWRETLKTAKRPKQVEDERPMTADELAARPKGKRLDVVRTKRLETPEEFGMRLMADYCGPEAGSYYRETRIELTDEMLDAYAANKAAIDFQVRNMCDGDPEFPVDHRDFSFSSASCIGPYGACDFLKLCTGQRDAADHFKPTEGDPIDGGTWQKQAWPQGKPSDNSGVRRVTLGGRHAVGGGAAPDGLRLPSAHGGQQDAPEEATGGNCGTSGPYHHGDRPS